MTTYKKLISNLKEFNDAVVIIEHEKQYTYADLYNQVDYYYKQIVENKITSSKIIVLLSDYSFKYISLLLALYQNGNIIVPITTKIEREKDMMISQVPVDFFIKIQQDNRLNIIENGIAHEVDEQKIELLNNFKKQSKSGLVLFSSGISGKPKSMLHDFESLVEVKNNQRKRALRFILFLLFDHIGGINTMLHILNSGGTMVLTDSRDPSHIAELIEKHKVNILPTTPTFLNLFLLSDILSNYDLSSLRLITYGTEPMPDSLLIRLKKKFQFVRFLQTFGTSETGVFNVISKTNSTSIKIDDSIVESKIVNSELWIRSKTQILGYLNHNQASFTKDGWFKTGDMVEEQEDGFIKIMGRFNEVINVGGQKVLPVEVESVLIKSENISSCRVYGVQNDITGQVVMADVVLNSDKGMSKGEARKILKQTCYDALEEYKIPVKIKFVDEIKINRRFKKEKFIQA